MMLSRALAAVTVSALFVAIAIPGDAAPPAKVSAFVHVVVAGGNVCGTDDHATVLNHPPANGNPNAVIVATSNTGASSAPGGVISPPGVLSVFYDDANSCGNALNRWVVVNDNTGAGGFLGGERINIFVSAP